MNFDLAMPYMLILLLLTLCFFWCKNYSEIFYFPKIEWITKQSSLLTLEPWLKVAIYSLMVLALAQPYIYDPSSNNSRRGRDLILAIDASGSMAQSGFDDKDRFKSKYEATIDISKEFIKRRADDNIGVVVFGTFAYSASPLTYDLSSLSYLVDMTTVGIAGDSTAIGDAIVQAIKTLSFGKAEHRVVILLTDGYHNAGKNSPKDGVRLAREKAVKIYTIGIGKSSGYDITLLETIAKESGGRSYGATTADDLNKIFREIEALEPSNIRGENFLHRYLLYYYPLGLSFGLLLLWIVARRRGLI